MGSSPDRVGSLLFSVFDFEIDSNHTGTVFSGLLAWLINIMLPVITIVGRPNTGKSTLFNRLTRTRNALVADRPGVTRDRHYGLAEHDGSRFIVVDTGGIGDTEPEDDFIAELVSAQTTLAIEEANAVFWLVDGRAGLSAADESLASTLRSYVRKLYLLVNKTDGIDADIACAEFHALGVGTPYPVSAHRGEGLGPVLELALGNLPAPPAEPETASPDLKIAVIGRPNAGKSTLVNRMLGEERMLVFDRPGTTRDSITIPLYKNGKNYALIDTAGVRRRSRLTDPLEKFSAIKSIQAVDDARIVMAVIDAQEALTDQDMHLLGIAVDSSKPIIIAVNKWDGLDKQARNAIKNQMDRKLAFAGYACIHFISALHGTGTGKLFNSIDKIAHSITLKVKSSLLTEILAEAVGAHAPPIIKGRRIKLRYAHLGGHDPLRIIIHGNQTMQVPSGYVRYLENYFRKRLKLTGTPVRIEFKHSDNPYKGRPNILTARQLSRRKRVIRHSSKQG